MSQSVLDIFVQRYFYLINEGWCESSETTPFQMQHKEYDGVYSIEEAYKLCQEGKQKESPTSH